MQPSQYKIQIVEDDEDVVEILQMLITSIGYIVRSGPYCLDRFH